MCCFFAAGVQYITLNLTNIQDFIFFEGVLLWIDDV